MAERLTTRWLGARLPPRTIRMRLTGLYGALFLASGAALLTVTYILVARRYNSQFFISNGKTMVVTANPGGDAAPAKTFETPVGIAVADVPSPQQVLAKAHAQSVAALHQLLIQSGIALALMAVVSIWLGWLVAGRALRPLRTITNAARDISASNLHRRLALNGPNDELKQLGNTFDALLERLQASFDAQRHFVANASHELRTPLTLERALVEVALADPQATTQTLRQTCEQVLAVGEQQERLIEALLTLSRSQRGIEQREPIDLAAAVEDALPATGEGGLALHAALEPATTSGDTRLIERLVVNLIGNAVRHNVPGGAVHVSTKTDGGRAVFAVSNTGPLIPPNEVDRLFQPFQRLNGERTSTNGVGLGLSIVQAIASAHGATLIARPQPEGGLYVEVDFPG